MALHPSLDAAHAAARVWPDTERALAPQAAARMAARLADAADPAWPGHLPVEVAGMLAGHGCELAAWIAARHQGIPRRVGLAGGQGSGKSTLAGLTAALLEREFGLTAVVLSLDDLYLSRSRRAQLAADVHPLFATRGVPGTHDFALGEALLAALVADSGQVALPRFDKAQDERLPESEWVRVDTPVDVLLFEGWCVGAAAEAEAQLEAPVNALERDEDPDGRWRRAVNAALAGPYASLFGALEGLVYLAIPDFAAAGRWREEQEAELRKRTGGGMTSGQVERFVAHYERLTRAMQRSMPARSDLLLELDESHRVASVRPGAGSGSRGFRRDSAPGTQHASGKFRA